MKRIGVILDGQTELSRGTRGRALRTANQIARTLRRFDAVPKRRSDQSLIGDLSVLELHAQQLSKAIRSLAASPHSRQGRRGLEDRLLDLQALIDNVAEVSRDARRPLRRMVASRVGIDGQIESLMRGITSGMEAVGINTETKRKSRGK